MQKQPIRPRPSKNEEKYKKLNESVTMILTDKTGKKVERKL